MLTSVPWLMNRGVSPFSGDSDHFWRGVHPPNNGMDGFVNQQELAVQAVVSTRVALFDLNPGVAMFGGNEPLG